MDEKCENCIYFKAEPLAGGNRGAWGWCRFNPETLRKSPESWCGKWASPKTAIDEGVGRVTTYPPYTEFGSLDDVVEIERMAPKCR